MIIRTTLTLKPKPKPEQAELDLSPRAERERAINALLDEWRVRYPLAFTVPRPLAIGIGKVLASREPVGRRSLARKALHVWTSRPQYLKALAEPGAQRLDLRARIIEPVSAEHRLDAKERLAKINPPTITTRKVRPHE